jgi:hypothetical protein
MGKIKVVTEMSRARNKKRAKKFRAIRNENQQNILGNQHKRLSLQSKYNQRAATKELDVPVMEIEELEVAALHSYVAATGRVPTKEQLTQEFINWLVLNHLRHSTKAYKDFLQEIKHKGQFFTAYRIITQRIYQKIRELYPHLSDLCAVQERQKLSQYHKHLSKLTSQSAHRKELLRKARQNANLAVYIPTEWSYKPSEPTL